MQTQLSGQITSVAPTINTDLRAQRIAEAEALLARIGVPVVNNRAAKAAHQAGKRQLRNRAKGA